MLIDRARKYVTDGEGTRLAILRDCMSAGSLDALQAVQLVFEDMYGGETYNILEKAPSAYCLLRWGRRGLDALVEAAHRSPRSKNISIAMSMLACLAAGGSGLPHFPVEAELQVMVHQSGHERAELAELARTLLGQFVLDFASDQDAAMAIGHQYTTLSISGNMAAASPLFEATALRFLTVGEPVLLEFEKLQRTRPRDEPVFQDFLARHPELLDPMAVEVWEQPALWGAREPDFIVRRADDTYLVVEIECPAKLLLTAAGQLSAETSHAVHQVIDYADRLAQRQEQISRVFPNFRSPDCLVLNGLEESLTLEQKRMLVLENAHRRGVRIAGFDWLTKRARATARNFVGRRVKVGTARLQ